MSQARKFTGTSRLSNVPPMEPTMASSLPNMRSARILGGHAATVLRGRKGAAGDAPLSSGPGGPARFESMAAGVGDRR